MYRTGVCACGQTGYKEREVAEYFERTASSYDRVATAYAEQFIDELAHKPLDRALLNTLIELAGTDGPIADIGCGPGQVTRYLHDRGATVTGIDLSAGMVAAAQAASPGVAFRQGSMLDLPLEDGSLAAIVSFYAIIHLRQEEIGLAFQEFRRVLRPGGSLLLAFHVGDQRIHRDEWWDQPVDLDFYFLDPEAIEAALTDSGFTVEMTMQRRPYEPYEFPSRRAYILARTSQRSLS
jgi:SAM-dependent methyltransferase